MSELELELSTQAAEGAGVWERARAPGFVAEAPPGPSASSLVEQQPSFLHHDAFQPSGRLACLQRPGRRLTRRYARRSSAAMFFISFFGEGIGQASRLMAGLLQVGAVVGGDPASRVSPAGLARVQAGPSCLGRSRPTARRSAARLGGQSNRSWTWAWGVSLNVCVCFSFSRARSAVPKLGASQYSWAWPPHGNLHCAGAIEPRKNTGHGPCSA